jgi:hypothetical protein
VQTVVPSRTSTFAAVIVRAFKLYFNRYSVVSVSWFAAHAVLFARVKITFTINRLPLAVCKWPTLAAIFVFATLLILITLLFRIRVFVAAVCFSWAVIATASRAAKFSAQVGYVPV